MPELELTEAAEEVLASLWVATDERNEPSVPMTSLDGEALREAVGELQRSDLVEEQSGSLSLTGTGHREAARIVRRERLAERLLVDVLDLEEAVATETACKFEHLLRRGVDDEICTLLGHPRVCPHGKPIPEGDCCRAGTRAAGKVISALADLLPGQRGVIAYIHGQRRDMMQRLLGMGAIPGSPIALLQRSPSYVFELGHRQIAVDRDTAEEIYVRLAGAPPQSPSRPGWFPRLVHRRRRRRGR